ncbi:MAG: hypothetical protein CMI08_18785 [Oceanospirillaceae bacterium]|uniref:hypothetical protein n=1 Tax=unclassified Thalassolituus TaxID=2624967 RepID=UPI000C6882A3|nr:MULTISPECIES: hypothetical protein [unclassified Thalassolituus]MAY01210.1 hypothetical protein [Oceanospirillaceae bacterium]MBL33328.1 hypothetical protein [Oceanospirillaceae bacterium]MBS55073.1 hypothetical protein [Oceanospirillaceae bacterium]|tara:strand:- start:894 stop:1295 length:402 start_codon:yes stop_codon:yes gene_type:complete
MLMASGLQSRPAELSVTSTTREKFVFPTPDKLAHGTQVAFCSKKRILSLFNKYTSHTQKNLTKPVKEWFASEALRLGWADAIETPADQAGTDEGITLLAPNNELTRKRRTLDVASRRYCIKAGNDENGSRWSV